MTPTRTPWPLRSHVLIGVSMVGGTLACVTGAPGWTVAAWMALLVFWTIVWGWEVRRG